MNSSDDVAFHLDKTYFSDLGDHKGIKKGDLGHFSRKIAGSMVFTMSERCEGSRTRVLEGSNAQNSSFRGVEMELERAGACLLKTRALLMRPKSSFLITPMGPTRLRTSENQ